MIKKEEIKVADEEKEALIKEAAENMNLEPEKYKEMYKKQIDSPDFEYAAKEKKLFDLLEKNSKFVPYPKEKETDKSDKELENKDTTK